MAAPGAGPCRLHFNLDILDIVKILDPEDVFQAGDLEAAGKAFSACNGEFAYCLCDKKAAVKILPGSVGPLNHMQFMFLTIPLSAIVYRQLPFHSCFQACFDGTLLAQDLVRL